MNPFRGEMVCLLLLLLKSYVPTIFTLHRQMTWSIMSVTYAQRNCGLTIYNNIPWSNNYKCTHVSNVCTKANRTLGFLRRNLYSCPQDEKEAAYKGLVRPVLDYDRSGWDPPGVVLQEELESVQKHTARFVTGNCSYETGSMTGILGQLKWESL